MNRCRWAMVLILLLLAGSPGCTRPPAAVAPPPARDADRGGATATAPSASGGGIDFVERAAELGIAATYRNGGESDQCTILESLGGGVGWFDFDRDGWLDLVATGGGGITAEETIHGRPCMLFRSEGGKTFHPAATEAGIASATLYSHGVAVGDHDNDGFQDLVVTGYGVPQFWRNLGDGTFVAAPSPAGEDARWSSSAGWADLNGDGVLDLYLTRYVNWSFDNHPRCGPSATVRDICPPRSFEGLPDAVCLGNGDGTFTDASAAAGLRSDGKGLGVLLADLDVDGDVDLGLLHIGAHLRLVVVRGGGAVDGRHMGAEADGEAVAVDRLLGLADGHDDPAPVGVLAGQGGLDQRAVGDRLGQFPGRGR